MNTLGFPSTRVVVLFSFGFAAGLLFSAASFSFSNKAHAALGSDIVCLVFTRLNGVGYPVPVLSGGSCPDDSTPLVPEDTAVLCGDGLDNDNDSLVDLADPDCAAFVQPPPQCSDGLDNDNDTFTDAADPSCHTDGDAGNADSYNSDLGDESANTAPLPTDMCQNLDGVQYVVPEGYLLDEESGDCVDQPPGDTGGTGDTGEEEDDSSTDTGGGSPSTDPPPPTDSGQVSSPQTGSGSSSGGGGSGNGVISGPLSIGYQGGEGDVLGTTTAATTTQPSPMCFPYLNSYLRIGKQNDPAEVKKLQTFLNEHMRAGLPATGYFGPLTDRAVRAFQLKYSSKILAPWVPFGLESNQTATGYVYKTTKRTINSIMCKGLAFPPLSLP